MLEFKLNYYFEMYKELPLPNRETFRFNFKKKHGNFQYLEELIKMIEDYQFKKYGETLNNHYKSRNTEEAKKISYKINRREKRRLRK